MAPWRPIPAPVSRRCPKTSSIVPHLVTAYYTVQPDPDDIDQQVAFGTSGHRGSSLDGAFNEAHILATTQAIAEYRAAQGTTGPLFIGRDTHALSEPAWVSALEVLAANDVVAMIDSADRYTPTPAVSHAILTYNRGRDSDLADGIVVTPSHNPPRDGGFKYNPPNGGPADTDATGVIAKRANEILRDGLADGEAGAAGAGAADRRSATTTWTPTSPTCPTSSTSTPSAPQEIRIGADPLGGASVDYWGAIAERHNLDLTVVNPLVDATWRFMTLDTDGKIRMDCSSPNAMASLIAKIGELPDRHRQRRRLRPARHRHPRRRPDEPQPLPGRRDRLPVHPPAGLAGRRPRSARPRSARRSSTGWSAGLGRKLVEVPVGFKWFVDGLISGTIGFGGEESAGASFLRRDGSVWTTDKDGIILALLASEILAVTGSTPSQRYAELADKYGAPTYARVDAPGQPGAEGAAGQAVARAGDRHRTGR